MENAFESGPKTANLLLRARMSLEDGAWQEAEQFYEAALNENATLAEAYLGKLLAQTGCVSLEALVDQRLQLTDFSEHRTLQLTPDTAFVDAAVAKYARGGCASEKKIRALFQIDLSYPSAVEARSSQYAGEKGLWESNKLLNRAAQLGDEALRAHLEAQKTRLLDTLQERLTQAQAMEDQQRYELQQRYADHLRLAEEQAAELQQRSEKQAGKAKKITVITSSAAVVILAAVLLVVLVILPAMST